MINLSYERPLRLAAAACLEMLPERRRDKKPSPTTLYRWATRGLRGLRLEVIRVGGTLCTSREALQRFFDALTRADTGAQAEPPAAREKARDARAAAAERELDRLGI